MSRKRRRRPKRKTDKTVMVGKKVNLTPEEAKKNREKIAKLLEHPLKGEPDLTEPGLPPEPQSKTQRKSQGAPQDSGGRHKADTNALPPSKEEEMPAGAKRVCEVVDQLDAECAEHERQKRRKSLIGLAAMALPVVIALIITFAIYMLTESGLVAALVFSGLWPVCCGVGLWVDYHHMPRTGAMTNTDRLIAEWGGRPFVAGLVLGAFSAGVCWAFVLWSYLG